MADIELVIKVDEKLYKDIFSDAEIMIYGGMRSGKTLLATLLRAIRKGTPLPKEHGRLIDADNIKTAFPSGEYVRTESIRATIDHEDTIIEADTKSEDQEL